VRRSECLRPAKSSHSKFNPATTKALDGSSSIDANNHAAQSTKCVVGYVSPILALTGRARSLLPRRIQRLPAAAALQALLRAGGIGTLDCICSAHCCSGHAVISRKETRISVLGVLLSASGRGVKLPVSFLSVPGGSLALPSAERCVYSRGESKGKTEEKGRVVSGCDGGLSSGGRPLAEEWCRGVSEGLREVDQDPEEPNPVRPEMCTEPHGR
jgi:hypothetical protein